MKVAISTGAALVLAVAVVVAAGVIATVVIVRFTDRVDELERQVAALAEHDATLASDGADSDAVLGGEITGLRVAIDDVGARLDAAAARGDVYRECLAWVAIWVLQINERLEAALSQNAGRMPELDLKCRSLLIAEPG